MSVNWNMSIGSSLSLNVLHPNKQEIEAIKLHLQSMGFELKRGKKNYCHVEVVSQFKIEHGLTLLSQKRTVFYDEKKPLRDLLHELDHVYQLQEEARKNNRPYLKASEVKVRLARGHTTTNIPFPIVNILFDTVIENDSFQIEDAVTVALNKRNHQTTILIGNSETMVKSVEANYTKCDTIINLVAAWNHLTEAEKRELFESGISKYENEEMEIAAYQREIQRSERFPQLYLNEKQIQELKSNAVENYLRFHLTKNLPQICNYSWVKEVSLKTLAHVYLESREEKVKIEFAKSYKRLIFFKERHHSPLLEQSLLPQMRTL